MQDNLKEMHLKLRHVDANSGTIMPMKRVKVQVSEQPKKKPKSTATAASGSSVMGHSDVWFHCPQVHWGNTRHLCWAWSGGF